MRRPPAAPGVVAEVAPRWPFRLPRRGGPDGVSRVRAGIFERFLRIDGAPVLVRAWQPGGRRGDGSVRISAVAVDPEWQRRGGQMAVHRRRGFGRRPTAPGRSVSPSSDQVGAPAATRAQLESAIERTRGALGVDDDYSDFYARFWRDPLIGPAIRRRPWLRVRRCPLPWEALCWAITEQLIEVERARAIQRRIVGRWGGVALPPDRERPLRDVPGPALIAARAPAELAALDLAPRRALAMVRAAREVASGRIDLELPSAVGRLLAISEIGPWTVQVLGQKGRGDPDSLPAGDLAFLKAVPRLVGMDRRATVAEVEKFFAPYAPYRGWAGLFALVAAPRSGPPLEYHPANPELEAA